MLRFTSIALLTIAISSLEAPAEEPPTVPRPVSWSAEVSAVFFEDARTVVVGERPDYERLNGQTDGQLDGSGSEQATLGESSGDRDWSQLISPDTIETEIKRLAKAVANDTQAAGPFKGGGYKLCRRHFTMLAALFDVVAQHDSDIRWQNVSSGLRDLFADAAQQCSKGTDESYRVANDRAEDLSDLVRGQRLATLTEDAKSNWNESIDRAQLMQRMEMAQKDRFSSWLESERTLRRNQDELIHQAEVLAMLGQMIQHEGFDFWDDETFVGFAQDLTSAAADLAVAAEEGNLANARAAAIRIGRTCADCHEGYRG